MDSPERKPRPSRRKGAATAGETAKPTAKAGRAKARTVQVNVTVADMDIDRFDSVVKQSREAGLTVENALPEIGIVTGTIAEDRITDLEKLPGVMAIERARGVQLAPPESDVQ